MTEPEPTDWEPLGEDVSLHTVMGMFPHDDGRRCVYHSRLASWCWGAPTDRRCLRDHIQVEPRTPTEGEATETWVVRGSHVGSTSGPVVSHVCGRRVAADDAPTEES